jgi:hypothetical protein
LHRMEALWTTRTTRAIADKLWEKSPRVLSILPSWLDGEDSLLDGNRRLLVLEQTSPEFVRM